MSDDLRLTGTTVHVEGCLWAGRRSRPWFGSGTSTRRKISDAVHRQGYILCRDCRPLDTLPDPDTTGASRG